MDEDGDGKISLEEFKNRYNILARTPWVCVCVCDLSKHLSNMPRRYARDEAKIMDGVRKNWRTIQQMLLKAKKSSNLRGRLDRPDFQEQLLKYLTAPLQCITCTLTCSKTGMQSFSIY